MYQFCYDYLKPIYGGKCTLLFRDIDSFCCHIQTEDVSLLLIQHIFAESSPGILRSRQILRQTIFFVDQLIFADSSIFFLSQQFFADSTNLWGDGKFFLTQHILLSHHQADCTLQACVTW